MTPVAVSMAALALAASVVSLVSLASFASVASAADVTLHVVRLPEGTTVAVPFASTGRAPAAATLEGELRTDGGRTRIALSWKKMKPALLFGGTVTSYVAWAVTKDGSIENLGELLVSGARGEAAFSTSRRDFGLMVTAEPFPLVTRPSDVVVFTGGAPSPGKAPSEPIAFGRFSGDGKPATPSIASLEWTSAEPVELSQARAIVEMAEREASGDPDRRLAREARVALSRAEGSPKGGNPKGAADEARRAAALASEALREVARRKEAEELARLEAEKRAQEAASKVAVVDEADRRRQAEATLAEIEDLRQKVALELERTRLSAAALAASGAQLEEERGRLVQEREALRRERDALAAGLADALEKVAPALETARGLVATLPGTSFDPGKAALRAASRVTVGKLAGILLMLPEHNVRIEGYTDSAGNAAANRKLSADRARNVADLLREQGIPDERIAFEGYGAANPVAPNATADGRALNRRIEIIVAKGTIEAAPMDVEATAK
ncbi:MAG: OmpA family protein [Holophagales bacterium]|nr:OmpA family protein [Holophagales bacterium]